MDYSVGELARRSGLTVRALHHYEELGLLRPSGRSEAGYRQYNEADVRRLHRLLALRQTGLALKDIGPLLDGEDPPLREVLAQQIGQIEAQMVRQRALLDALQHVARRADMSEAAEPPPFAAAGKTLIDHLLFAMSMMRMHDKYLSDADRQSLATLKSEMGEQRLSDAEAEWPRLIAQARQAMQDGVPAQSPEVQAIARRWVELTEAFVGKNEALRAKVSTMYAKEGELQRYTGVTPELIAYLREAMAAVRAQKPGTAPAA
ncbi:MerR family transcriptional regulator [Paucibacter sp. APW11]|uniref:MerR family transcriptional regulator n=1 Tax=Roseateles aquae TaxID=3077235 RepID=A0ABU3PE22_9BURK|nr:MerR family transcriptional regulator [Paucibacter sp. APW11]MDT9000836.1 MerR family transcriptional regulator [Paucibacter sp. APW11]